MEKLVKAAGAIMLMLVPAFFGLLVAVGAGIEQGNVAATIILSLMAASVGLFIFVILLYTAKRRVR